MATTEQATRARRSREGASLSKGVAPSAPAPMFWTSFRAAKLVAVAAVLLALALMLAAPSQAGASEMPSVADSDGYVSVYYACFAGPSSGYYDWYSDGYAVYGSITIDSCLMDSLGAGPFDYERVLSHEFGHAAGYGTATIPTTSCTPTNSSRGRRSRSGV